MLGGNFKVCLRCGGGGGRMVMKRVGDSGGFAEAVRVSIVFWHPISNLVVRRAVNVY